MNRNFLEAVEVFQEAKDSFKAALSAVQKKPNELARWMILGAAIKAAPFKVYATHPGTGQRGRLTFSQRSWGALAFSIGRDVIELDAVDVKKFAESISKKR